MRMTRAGKVTVSSAGILVESFGFEADGVGFPSHWEVSGAAMRWAIKMLQNELDRRERGGSGEKEILEHEIDQTPALPNPRKGITYEGETIDE